MTGYPNLRTPLRVQFVSLLNLKMTGYPNGFIS